MLFKHSPVAKARPRRCWKWSKLIDSRRFHLHLVIIAIVHLRSVVERWSDGWDVPRPRCKCPCLKRTRWYLPNSGLILPITRSAKPKAKSTRLRLRRGKREKQTNLRFARDKKLAIEAPKRQSRWSMFDHCREPYALSLTVLLSRKYQQSWRRQSRRHCLTQKNHRWDWQDTSASILPSVARTITQLWRIWQKAEKTSSKRWSGPELDDGTMMK